MFTGLTALTVLAGTQAPRERRHDVVDLGGQSVEALGILTLARVIDTVRETKTPRQVPVAAGLHVAVLGQPRQTMRADRLEQAVPRVAVPLLQLDERAVDEFGKSFDGVVGNLADVRCRLDGAAAAEHRETSQQRLLVVGEQVDAPVDDIAQCAVRCGASGQRDAGQRGQPVVESGDQMQQRDRPKSAGSEFESERKPVEPPAESLHRVRIEVGDGRHQCGTVEEEAYRRRHRLLTASPAARLAAHSIGFFIGCQIGLDGERPEPEQPLATGTQRAAARHQHAYPRTRVEQPVCQVGNRVDNLVGVVDDEQEFATGHVSGEIVRVAVRRFLRSERVGHQRLHLTGIADGHQVAECDTMPEPFPHGGRDLQGQPGLADTAGAGHGDEAMLVQCVGELGRLVRASDEAVTQRRKGPLAGRDRDVEVRLVGDRLARALRRTPVELGRLQQDGLVQRLQLAAWLDAEFVDEELPTLLERRQRIDLPAAAVEREDVRVPEPFAVGMVADQRVESADQGRVLTAPKLRLGLPFVDRRPLFVERRGPGLQRGVGAEVAVRGSAPQGQCLGERLGGAFIPPGAEQFPTLVGQQDELVSVDGVSIQVEEIALADGADQPAGSACGPVGFERAAESGQLAVQNRGRGGRRLAVPQSFGEQAGGADLARVGEQDCEQELPLRSAEPDGAMVAHDFYRAEYPELHGTPGPLWAFVGPRGRPRAAPPAQGFRPLPFD